jgi:signal peptidase I
MPQSSAAKFLMALLKAMENPWVVFSLAALVLLVRLAWGAYRKRHPLAPVAPGPPVNPVHSTVKWVAALLPLVLGKTLNISLMYAAVGAVVAYLLADWVIGLFNPAPPALAPALAPSRGGKGTRAAAPVTADRAVSTLPPAKDFILEILDTLLIALVLVFGLVRPLFLQTFFIPSPSMEPTLLGPVDNTHVWALNPDKQVGGDKLIASKWVYHFRHPRRGEIVVFRPVRDAFLQNYKGEHFGMYELFLREWLEANPDELSQLNPRANAKMLLAQLLPYPNDPDDFIKRVIGAPGDHLRTVAGVGVYRNGQLLDEPYVDTHMTKTAPIDFPVAPAPLRPAPKVADFTDENEWFPALLDWIVHDWYPHNMYATLIAPHVVKENGVDVFVVPPDSLFMMGDNRSQSFDSRYWGVIPMANARARAVSTFWPLSRLKLL